MKIPKPGRGSLTVIGTGIKTMGQLTIEAIAWIKEAEALHYLVADPIGESVIKNLNAKHAVSLADCYEEGKPRIKAYNKMVVRILKSVRSGKKTVAAFYGHPGIFAYPSHESIKVARKEGYFAQMLPGISAEDCLFADLGVDPGEGGCQSYEATDFLLNVSIIDPYSQLILWQVGILCDWTYKRKNFDRKALPILVEKLARSYPLSHSVTIYEAASLPTVDPKISEMPLWALPDFPLIVPNTLYVPPIGPRIPDPEIVSSFKA